MMGSIEMGLTKIQELLGYVFTAVSSIKHNRELIINMMIQKEKKEIDFGELSEEQIRNEFIEDEKELIQKSQNIIKTLNTISQIFVLNEFKTKIYQMTDISNVKTGLLLLDRVADEIYSGEMLVLEELKAETTDIEMKEHIEVLIDQFETLIEKIVDLMMFCSISLNIDLEDQKG